MTFFHALILGIVEGLTEYLPISSTAHLVLASDVLKLAQTEFLKSFEIIIQSGAILAVLVLYWRKFLNIELIKRLIVAFIPTGVIGYVLYKIIKEYFIGNTSLILWVLGIGGLVLIIFEKFYGRGQGPSTTSLETMNYKTAFAVGVFQAFAVVPGVSRAAATIIGGMLWGVSRTTIVEFSFLLAVPTLMAATALDIIKNPEVLTGGNFGLLSVGFIAAFVTAALSIKLFLGYIRRHTFTSFGVYRIVAAIVFALIIFR
jgi:undecaprenyl-diphosphatase